MFSKTANVARYNSAVMELGNFARKFSVVRMS